MRHIYFPAYVANPDIVSQNPRAMIEPTDEINLVESFPIDFAAYCKLAASLLESLDCDTIGDIEDRLFECHLNWSAALGHFEREAPIVAAIAKAAGLPIKLSLRTRCGNNTPTTTQLSEITNMRNIRLTLFLTQEELNVFKAVKREDQTLSASVRILALDKAGWYVANNRKPRPKTALDRTPQQQENAGPEYDYSDSQ